MPDVLEKRKKGWVWGEEVQTRGERKKHLHAILVDGTAYDWNNLIRVLFVCQGGLFRCICCVPSTFCSRCMNFCSEVQFSVYKTDSFEIKIVRLLLQLPLCYTFLFASSFHEQIPFYFNDTTFEMFKWSVRFDRKRKLRVKLI